MIEHRMDMPERGSAPSGVVPHHGPEFMTLKILLPVTVLLEETTDRIVAEGLDGSFCLRPRHIDFVSALGPGILTFQGTENQTYYVAVDEGILVKTGSLVRVSTRRAVRGPDLQTLRQTVMHEFRLVDERERSLQSAMARLEADFVRRFLQFGEPFHG